MQRSCDTSIHGQIPMPTTGVVHGSFVIVKLVRFVRKPFRRKKNGCIRNSGRELMPRQMQLGGRAFNEIQTKYINLSRRYAIQQQLASSLKSKSERRVIIANIHQLLP